MGPGLGGTPLNIVSLFTDTPRALAVSADGARVYAAGMATGNQTTSINEFILTQIQQATGQPIMPPPITNHAGVPQPPTGLMVRYNGTNWVDEIGRPWDPFVMFSLPDKDVFVIDAAANPPQLVAGDAGSYAHVGTVLFNMAASTSTTRPAAPSPNPESAQHGDAARHGSQPRRQHALRGGDGSSKVGIYGTAALENDTFVPDAADQVQVSGGGRPSPGRPPFPLRRDAQREGRLVLRQLPHLR